MARCEYCGRDMLHSSGCLVNKIIIDGRKYSRHKVTSNSRYLYLKNGKCCDCGAREENYHHIGCEAEICPACGKQLISCECENMYIEEI